MFVFTVVLASPSFADDLNSPEQFTEEDKNLVNSIIETITTLNPSPYNHCEIAKAWLAMAASNHFLIAKTVTDTDSQNRSKELKKRWLEGKKACQN